MIVIGLTGGFGSGKSTVSRMLQELGARVLDADKVGHRLYQPGTPVWKEVVAAFGPGIVQANREIDRKKLGEVVFKDHEALKRLNAIMHPRMFEAMKETLEGWRREGVKVAVLEAAILFEANWTPLVDQVWVTRASEEKVAERLGRDKGLSPAQVRSRLASQMSVEEKAKRAQVVIDNSGPLEQVKKQVEGLWQRLNSP